MYLGGCDVHGDDLHFKAMLEHHIFSQFKLSTTKNTYTADIKV